MRRWRARGAGSRGVDPGSRAAGMLTHVVLIALSVVTLVPTAWLVLAAFKPEDKFAPQGRDVLSLFIPKDVAGEGEGGQFLGRDWRAFTLKNMAEVFAGGEVEEGAGGFSASGERIEKEVGITTALRNSVFFASVGPLVCTLVSAMAGYALARLRFVGQKWILGAAMAALIVPAPLLFAPTFSLLEKLGLLNTLAGVILPGLASAFGVFLFRQATVQSVPAELIDAAMLDGCGELRSFFAVALPLLRPMVGAFLIVMFLATWNNFITPQIVLQTPELLPLSVMIVQLRGSYGDDYGLLMAGTLVSVLPVALVFVLLQGDFVRGLTAGAVKG